MDLSRRNNIAVGTTSYSCSQIERYLRVIIDIYSSSEIRRDLWLTEREKEFFISTIIHVIQGHVNPISDEAVQIYKKYFNPNTNKVKISDYINRIRKKGWIEYDKRKRVLLIPGLFEGITMDGDVMTFNLRFSYEPINRSDTDRAAE